jgi:hypothetical protein
VLQLLQGNLQIENLLLLGFQIVLEIGQLGVEGVQNGPLLVQLLLGSSKVTLQ